MVPISKSIWPLILFVYANFYFVAIARFNSSFCFLKTFSRKRSSPSPPNFAPPFCALCLIVCDFLPKTWNLGRKEGKSALSGAPEGTPPVAYGDSPLGDGAFGMTVRFPAKVQSLPPTASGAPLPSAPVGTPPVAYGDSPLGDGAFGIAAQFQAEAQSLRARQRLPLRGSWQSRRL